MRVGRSQPRGGGFSTPGRVRPSQWPTGLAVGLGLRGLPLPNLACARLGIHPLGALVPPLFPPERKDSAVAALIEPLNGKPVNGNGVTEKLQEALPRPCLAERPILSPEIAPFRTQRFGGFG